MANALMRAAFERCKPRYNTRPAMENAAEHKMLSPTVCQTRPIPWRRSEIYQQADILRTAKRGSSNA